MERFDIKNPEHVLDLILTGACSWIEDHKQCDYYEACVGCPLDTLDTFKDYLKQLLKETEDANT